MTVAYTANDLLGIGIYTVAEAAVYARVSASKLSRWILGTSSSRPAVIARLDPDRNEERWVTFWDFIQSMAIRDVRLTHRIHLDRIRETVEMAKSVFSVDYPFARKHTTWLLDNCLYLKIKNYGIVTSTGEYRGQLAIPPVIESYLEDVSYDGEGLADGYTPYTHKGYKIVFNPRRQFGEPIVSPTSRKLKPCRYTARSLRDAYISEGSYSGASRAMGVSQEAVEAACKYFYDYLKPIDDA